MIAVVLILAAFGGWFLIFSQKNKNGASLRYQAEPIAQLNNDTIDPDNRPPTTIEKDAQKVEQLKNNVTSRLLDNVVYDYLVLKQNNVDKDITRDILEKELLNNAKNIEPLEDQYSKDDIGIIQPSQKNIRLYANTIGTLFKKGFEGLHKSELILLQEIVQENSAGTFQEFEPYYLAYQNAAYILEGLPVPSSYIEMHVSLLNNFNNLSKINYAFQHTEIDPLKSIFYMNYYTNEVERFASFITNIAEKLIQDGIVFNTNEDGALLFEYYDQQNSNIAG